MNPIENLKQEHEDIERELIELEAIMNSEIVNYGNLTHTFKKLHVVWNHHEEKEEKIFPVLKKDRIIIPVEIMQFEHKLLKPHKKAMYDAINSGSEFLMKKALDENCSVIIKTLRKHIKDEDEVLYTITLEEFSPQELEEVWKMIE